MIKEINSMDGLDTKWTVTLYDGMVVRFANKEQKKIFYQSLSRASRERLEGQFEDLEGDLPPPEPGSLAAIYDAFEEKLKSMPLTNQEELDAVLAVQRERRDEIFAYYDRRCSSANTLIMRKSLIHNLLHDKDPSVQVVNIECLILNQNISG
jgi:hypothetical protein